MAVHFSFASTKASRSVPCVGDSISLAELKDAIAAPLVVALRGKKLKETFDFRVYDVDTKEEIVGANTRVRKNASVTVKRVPAASLVSHPVVQLGGVQRSGLEAVSNYTEKVLDDDFGEDVYSASSVSTMSSKEVEKVVEKESRKKKVPCNENVSSIVRCKEVEKVVEKARNESTKNSKKEEVPRNETGVQSVQVSCSDREIPEELLCALCKNIMNDPMLIPCCCNSFCRHCIQVALVGLGKCPNCESFRCRDADLLPNRHIKSIIDGYVESNSSASSGVVSSNASCSSQTTSFRVVVAENKNVTDQKTSVSSGVDSEKRKPLIISLAGGSKRLKVK